MTRPSNPNSNPNQSKGFDVQSDARNEFAIQTISDATHMFFTKSGRADFVTSNRRAGNEVNFTKVKFTEMDKAEFEIKSMIDAATEDDRHNRFDAP